jgi:hypothetical protein
MASEDFRGHYEQLTDYEVFLVAADSGGSHLVYEAVIECAEETTLTENREIDHWG